MNPSPLVICLGVATLDQIFRVDKLPAPPAKKATTDFVVTGGGMASTASVAVTRLGGRAQYWGRVGTDLVGDQVIELMKAEGVDTRYVMRLPGARTKVAAVIIDDSGERLVISAPSQGYPHDASWLPLAEVKKAQAVLGDTRWLTGSRTLFAAAHSHGIPSVFDADSGDPDAVLAIAQNATHPVYGETMLQRLDMGPPEEAVKRAFGGHNQVVGVTLGERGVVWFDGKTVHTIESIKIKSIDTLGAGDTFHGALAMALAEGQSNAQALRFANVTAAIKCTRFGGREGIPKRAEVDAMLKTTA